MFSTDSDGVMERKGDRSTLKMGRRPREGKGVWASHCIVLLVTVCPLHVLLPEQAREAAGQLLRWKGDVDQDGYLLLKSVFVLTGTNSVSSGPQGPHLGAPHSCAAESPSKGQWHISSVSFFL